MKGLIRDIVLITSFIIAFLTCNQMISQHYNIILMVTFFPFVLGGVLLLSVGKDQSEYFKQLFQLRLKQQGNASYVRFFITSMSILICCISIVNFSVMIYQIIFVLYFIASAYFLVKFSRLLGK